MVFGCAEPDELYPDWKRDFGRNAPLELEIGPGRGAFALDHAARHPEIDLAAGGLREAAGRTPRSPLHARAAICGHRPAGLSRALPQSAGGSPPDSKRTHGPRVARRAPQMR